ncbi:hypothetical protein Tco_1183275 [Tanacetum coccineum]
MKETSYELLKDDQKKKLGKNNKAKMTLYNALPPAFHKSRIARLISTQEYDNFQSLIRHYDSGFTRFNAIVASLKSLNLDYSSKNHMRKFLCALPLKWRAKVTAIEEVKDLATLPLDELIGNLKVYEMVLDNDGVASKTTKEKVKSLALKAKVTREQTSDDINSQGGSDKEIDDEEAEEFILLATNFRKFFRKVVNMSKVSNFRARGVVTSELTESEVWYQSGGSKSWEKPIPNRMQKGFEKGYLLREAYNASKGRVAVKEKGEGSINITKEKRAPCYICRKRGHVFWKCQNKKNSTTLEAPTIDNQSKEPTMVRNEERLKYPENIHVKTDYMIEDFKVEGTQHERKIIFSHGIGEAMVETSEKKIVIPGVLYTPKITLNLLSLDQLMAQGFVVTYGHNKCQIFYMFEEDKEGCDGETDCATSKEGNGCDVEIECMIAKHNKYLEEYIDSIDSKDALNSFKRFISFLDLIKNNSIVFKNWELLRKRWKEVAVIHGLTEAYEEDLKACYKRTIDMVKFCYDTTLRPWFKEEPVKCEKTKKVEGGCDHAKEENPQEHNGSSKNGLGVVRENTHEYFENVQRSETRFGVILEGNNDTDVDQMADQED